MDQNKPDEIVSIPINQLVFDPENPRLPETIRKKKNHKDYEKLVIEWMLQFENITELMGSIGQMGFFSAEPLLVVKKKDEEVFEVIEGNRRLTASKLLNEPNLANSRRKSIEEVIAGSNADVIPNKLPVVIFNSREDILSYLGYKHITGVEAWDSLAKAKFLKQLLKTLPNMSFVEDCRTLAKMIGSKSNYVRLLLIGVDIYHAIEDKDFFQIKGLNEETFEFGVFYTAIGRTNIGKYVGVSLDSETPLAEINIEKLEDLTRWVFEETAEGYTRIGESRNLRILDKILDHKFPRALTAFKEGRSLDEASRLTDEPEIVFVQGLISSLTNLEIARDTIHEIDDPSDQQLELLRQISRITSDLFKLLQLKKNDNQLPQL